MRPRLLAIATVVMLASCASAHADELFTLTTARDTISFTLPERLPGAFGSNYFYIFNVPVAADGTTTIENLEFDDPSAYGRDLIISAFNPEDPSAGDSYLLLQQGPQLFTGTSLDPLFSPGTFQLSQVPASDIAYTGNFSLTISAAAPEPSTIALLGTGMLGIAGVIRRQVIR